MSLVAISLGDRLCPKLKDRKGGGGWVRPKAENSMAMPGL